MICLVRKPPQSRALLYSEIIPYGISLSRTNSQILSARVEAAGLVGIECGPLDLVRRW